MSQRFCEVDRNELDRVGNYASSTASLARVPTTPQPMPSQISLMDWIDYGVSKYGLLLDATPNQRRRSAAIGRSTNPAGSRRAGARG
jgi:hypothetical protein